MLRWLRRFAVRYFVFCVYALTGAMAFSWLFGFDDEMRAWASQNRPLIALLLSLSAIIYGMYFWLDENTVRS